MKQIEQQNKRVSPSPQKGAITERGLFRLMLPSLLGILLCSTCLAGLTWAYFSDSVTSSANTITAATFTVDVTIEETGSDETNGNSVNEAGGQEEYTLTANVLSVGTTTSPADTPTNEKGGTDTETGTQQGSTPVVSQGDEGSSSDTGSENGTGSETGAGSETGTGEGSTSKEGTSGGGSDPEIKAAGEGTLAASSLPNMESKTDTPITTTAVKRNADGSYTLTAGKKYTVTLTASGNTKGYCKVTVNENDYYTEKMDPAQELQELVFSIDCSSMTSETTVRITPGWVNSDYPNIEGEAATNKIDSGSTIGTSTTDDNATEQADPPAVEEPSADTDETLRGETGQSNEQTNNGETAGGTTADTNDETTSGSTCETARTVPGESSKTTGESTDRDEEPANEGTDTEKANSEPSADEPTAPPSEGQSEE